VPQIAGVNTIDGVNRVAGNSDLYLKLLWQFVSQYTGVATQILAAIDDGDSKQAERIAHTVKGVAGNLGIAGLQAAAQKLEKGIREGQSSVPMLMEQFATTLRVDVNSITQALPASAASQSVIVPYDPERAASAVTRLKALLEASDGDSQEAFQVFRQALAAEVDARYLDDLGRSIDNFEFEQAMVKLEEIDQLCRHKGNS